MRFSRIHAIGLCLPLVVGCTQPGSPSPLAPIAPAGLSGAAAGTGRAGARREVSVPFKGTFEGLLTMSTPLTFPLLSNLIEGTGTSTHLGRLQLRMPHIVDRVTRIGTGTYEFLSADSDTVIADFSGQATVIAAGVLSSADTAVIRGGTGRFSGATGRFTAERIFVMASGEVTGSFEGTISFFR